MPARRRPVRVLKLPWMMPGEAAFKAWEKAYSDLSRAHDRLNQSHHSLQKSWADQICRVSSAWPQICFLHLAKTAGSSINEILRRRFSDLSGVWLTPEDLDQRPARALKHLGLVSAHFSINHLPLLSDHRFLFTFLREPVDRVISSYYHLHWYEGAPEPDNVALMSAKSKTFHDFLRDDHPQVRSFTENLQAHGLVSDWRGEKRTVVPDLGRRAIEAMNQFDFVGIFEHYEKSLRALFQLLRWRMEPGEATTVVNKTRNRPRVDEIEPKTLGLICELNQADQELYEHALAKWNERYGLK